VVNGQWGNKATGQQGNTNQTKQAQGSMLLAIRSSKTNKMKLPLEFTDTWQVDDSQPKFTLHSRPTNQPLGSDDTKSMG
jgi:hypothetical protein